MRALFTAACSTVNSNFRGIALDTNCKVKLTSNPIAWNSYGDLVKLSATNTYIESLVSNSIGNNGLVPDEIPAASTPR